MELARILSAPAEAEVALFESLDAVAADADGALDRARQARLYDRLDWARLIAAHDLAPGKLLVARAALDDARAWLFLAADRHGGAQPHGCWYTLAFAPVFANADGISARVALLGRIARALAGRLGHIALSPLGEEEHAEVGAGFMNAGWRVTAEPASQNWVAHTEGLDFDAYWASRPSQLRNTARRKGRDDPFEIELLDRFDVTAWEAYEAVYAASWKPAEGSPAFLRTLAEQEGAAGTLRMGIARRAGRPVAAQLWLVEGGIATIHKLAYDDAEKASSPGTVLSEAMFRRVIDGDRPRLIDFGTGDDTYKADWMDEKRPLYRMTLANPRKAGGIWKIARAAAKRAITR